MKKSNVTIIYQTNGKSLEEIIKQILKSKVR